MTRYWCALAMAGVFCLAVGSVQAQGWNFDTDLVLLKPHLETGQTTDGAFDFESTPRLALGYTGAADVGWRLTYWEFNQTGDAGLGRLDYLDTFNLDLELVKRLELAENTLLELTAGVRTNNTRCEFDTDPLNFNGFGAVLGGKVGLDTNFGGLVYARGKLALLGGSANDDRNLLLFDTMRQQIEVGLGYEHPLEFERFTLVPRAGFEWQNWEGFAPDPVDEHADASLGFIGFVGGLSVVY